MEFAFDSDEAIHHLKDALKEHGELTEVFDRASKDISNAFTASGDIVSGTLGNACANCWGDGSSDFFKKKLLLETEKFLHDKVTRIIRMANTYNDSSKSIYDSGAKSVPK